MLNKEKDLIIVYMKKTGKTDATKAAPKRDIAIFTAKNHSSGRNIPEFELVPFEKAVDELIKERILVSDSKSIDKFYLDFTKI